MAPPTYRQHETAFCAEVSKWCDKLFDTKPDLPFGSSDIESFGRGSQKRQDFRVYERSPKGRGKLALCGEVKLPGSQQGHSPFDMRLMQDAFSKATTEACRYFFTWNVEHLALFDRALWDTISMHERCIGERKLGLELNKPEEVTRPEVRVKLQDEFLPRFLPPQQHVCKVFTRLEPDSGPLAAGGSRLWFDEKTRRRGVVLRRSAWEQYLTIQQVGH